MTDRGVSEVLGFVLVFAIVTATIGIVYASGFTGLADVQHAEQLRNMERAFDVLDDNMADLHRRAAPSRATEVKLAGGFIGTGDAVKLTVSVVNTSNASRNDTFLMSANPIVYDDGDGTEIVYSMGGVFRTDDGNTAMLSEPDWVTDSDRAVIPFVVTFPQDAGIGVGGRTKVLLVASHEGSSLNGPFAADGGADVRVNVTVESPRADAWKRYFEDQGYTAIDGDASDDEVTYQFLTDIVYAPKTSIELDIER